MEGSQSVEALPLGFIATCVYCDRVYIKEHSYKRHIVYCRRRVHQKPRTRQVSCVSCRTAKSKCTFESTGCARCLSSGSLCVYDNERTSTSEVPDSVSSGRLGMSNTSIGPGHVVAEDFPSDWVHAPTNTFADALSDASRDGFLENLTSLNTDNANPMVVTLPEGSMSDPLWLSGSELEASSYATSLGHEVAPRDTGNSMQCSVYTQDKRLLTKRAFDGSDAQHAAILVMRTIRAYPQMMLRRETFPPFIHGQWHEEELPEELATCMSIAQIYVCRTPQTRPFLWRTVMAEVRRLESKTQIYNAKENLIAESALMIYTIMAMVDQDEDTFTRGAEILFALERLYKRFTMSTNGRLAELESHTPSLDWESYIFAETRRRLGCFWFLMTSFTFLELQPKCSEDRFDPLMPLCTGRRMWEARTKGEYETEMAFYGMTRLPRELSTLEQLVKVYGNPGLRGNAELMDDWSVHADGFGTLMGYCPTLLLYKQNETIIV